jgi:hypothetical protein
LNRAKCRPAPSWSGLVNHLREITQHTRKAMNLKGSAAATP